MRVAFILNPAAKNGRAGRLQGTLVDAARTAGLDPTLVLTTAPGSGTDIARDLAGRFDAVVAVGGDGTVQEVMAGLRGTDAAFGVVPMGTGNDFAAALGMSTRLPVAMAQIATSLQAGTSALDLGRVRWRDEGSDLVHERLFSNCLGAGFDGLAAHFAPRFKRLGGQLSYMAAIVKALGQWKQNVEVDVFVDDEASADAAGLGSQPNASAQVFSGPFFLCDIGNGHSVGGGFHLTPDASPTDGLLDVCCAAPLSLRRIAVVLPMAQRGRHTTQREITMGRGSRVVLRATSGRLPMHADGEALSRAAVEVVVEVLPGAVRAIGPALAGGGQA